ncbi:MAG: MFS transporter [Gammaproteobacteria bacterium]|nr:MFS transporter [Gammaproteobacteria bacterium]
MPASVYLLALCQALMMTGNTVVISASALVGETLASAPALATIPFGVQFLGMALTTFPASLLMQKIGRRAGFILGAGIGLIGAGVCTFAIVAQSMAWFVAGSFAIGSFSAMAQYYRFAAADVAAPEIRARAISYVLAGGVIAAFLGPNLARYTRALWPEHLFAGCFAALMILMVLSALLAAALQIPRTGAVHAEGCARPTKTVIMQPIYIVAVLGAMVGYGVMNLLMSATPLAMKFYGHAFDETAFVIQWHVMAMFAPSFVTGSLIARFGVLQVMAAGAVLLIASVFANLAGQALPNFYAALILLGLGWNFLFVGGTFLLTQAHRPAEKAVAQGINDLLVFSAVTLTALSSGMVQFAVGWRMVNAGVLPLVLVVLVSLLWLAWRQRSAAPASRA